jgi:hypothetical protein
MEAMGHCRPSGGRSALRIRFANRHKFIQLLAPRDTEWTPVAGRRYLAAMNQKRQRYDPLAKSTETRWLVRVDLYRNVIDALELASGTDLRAALADGIEQLRRDGWENEGVSFGSTFVCQGEERHQLGVYPTDPYDLALSLHGQYPGSR